MKQAIRRGVAVTIIVLVVGIVVSPFVDLPLTAIRAWDGLVSSGLGFVIAVGGVTAISLSSFVPVGRWGPRPFQYRALENRAGELSLNVAWLC